MGRSERTSFTTVKLRSSLQACCDPDYALDPSFCPAANMNFTPLNPRPLLQNLINDEVIIRLKWGQTEYKGRLISVDSYMNIQLSNTEEYIDRKHTGTLGEVLIRCNNVLWISAAKGVEMNGEADTKMEG